MHGCSNIADLDTGVSLHSSPVLKETARYFGGDFSICAKHYTTETGRLFFRRRTKQLPLARKPNVLGHVAKRT